MDKINGKKIFSITIFEKFKSVFLLVLQLFQPFKTFSKLLRVQRASLQLCNRYYCEHNFIFIYAHFASMIPNPVQFHLGMLKI